MAAEAHQEQRLGLADDVPGDANHDVVELAVREVVLDPGASRPGDGAVDHVELAVVGPADLVLSPVEGAVVGVEAVLVPGKEVVDDDLRAGVRESGEHRPGRPEHLASLTVDDHANLDSLFHLLDQEVAELGADLSLPPAEHQDVHRRVSRLDVGEDLGEEGLALGPGLERRGGRPGVGHPDVGRSWVAPGGERLYRLLRAGSRDRIRGRRPARLLDDREHLSRHEEEERREQDPDDGQHGPPPTPQASRRS